MFPLILLQAKAGGYLTQFKSGEIVVSINSPSGEGGGYSRRNPLLVGLPAVSINTPSGEGGGSCNKEDE